jgi:hypothetical protein
MRVMISSLGLPPLTEDLLSNEAKASENQLSGEPTSPKQHIIQSTVASIITASNALTKNLSSATRTPAALL